jgi:hypothetical protein
MLNRVYLLAPLRFCSNSCLKKGCLHTYVVLKISNPYA